MKYHLKEFKRAIEYLIISTLLNYQNSLEFDLVEFEYYKLDYNHFSSSYTTKLLSKAIRLLQDEKKPFGIDDVIFFLDSKNAKYDKNEVIRIMSANSCTYETFCKYVKQLEEINAEIYKIEELENLLRL